MTAAVTDKTGETRSAESHLRAGYVSLIPFIEAPETAEAGSDVEIKISAENLNGREISAEGKMSLRRLIEPPEPVPAELERGINYDRRYSPPAREAWSSWPAGEIITEQKFRSIPGEAALFNLSGLKEGIYRIEAVSNDKAGKEARISRDFMVHPGRDDRKFPLKLPFFIHLKEESGEAGEDVDILWGTGYPDGRAFIEIEHKGKILKRLRTPPERTMYRFLYPVTKELEGGFNIHITFVRQNRLYFRNIHIDVPRPDKELQLSMSSFRNRLLPGEKENWILKIKNSKGGAPPATELAAVLYDSSLDAFYPHTWRIPNIFSHYNSGLTSLYSNSRSGYSGFTGDRVFLPSAPMRTYWQFPVYILNTIQRRAVMVFEHAESELVSVAPARSNRRVKEMSEPADSEYSEEDIEAKDDEEEDFPVGDIRENLEETAFFYPHLEAGEDGTVSLEFTIPEALTRWKFMALAHGKGMESGFTEAFTVTQKELMIEPNPPRFLREGDMLELTARISNLSDKDIEAEAKLKLENIVTGEAASEVLREESDRKIITVKAGVSETLSWRLKVPRGMGHIRYVAAVKSENRSDAEAGLIPVLPSRIFLTDSLPLWINGPGEKSFNFETLRDGLKSPTLEPHNFKIEMVSNPSWYVLMALPYLIEYPHECSEQIFSRYYGNLMASHILNSAPEFEKIFRLWRKEYPEVFKSELDKNLGLKNISLKETPWVRDAEREGLFRQRLSGLFERNTLERSLERALEKLREMQKPDGSWSWFPGGRSNEFITVHIITGFGRLMKAGAASPPDFVLNAVDYLDRRLKERYEEIEDKEKNNLSKMIAYYLYSRSFFLDMKEIPRETNPAVEYYLGQAVKYWLPLGNRMSQGHLSIALKRFGDEITAEKIIASLLERSVTDSELGRYWRDTETGPWWYMAPVETQALMIEALYEVSGNLSAIDECRLWLLKQRQARSWKSTKATTAAVYALILRGTDWISGKEPAEIRLAGLPVERENLIPGLNYYSKSYPPAQIREDFADIVVKKINAGPAWGGAYFQYSEEISDVGESTGPLSLEKSLWVEKLTDKGIVLERPQGEIRVGDRLISRIILRTDRDLEYVHLNDQRGSGAEPENVLSRRKYRDGLSYYESTGDTSTDFFMSYMRKGTYVFEYPVRIQHRGEYESGIAKIQCMYAPEFSSRSGSVKIRVR